MGIKNIWTNIQSKMNSCLSGKVKIGILSSLVTMGVIFGSSYVFSDTITEETNLTKGDKDAQALAKNVRNIVEKTMNESTNFGLFSEGIGEGTLADFVITQHFGNYCSSDSATESGASNIPGKNCTSDVLLEYGDIKLSSLISSSVYDPNKGEEPPSAQDAAKQYMRNLINAIPTGFKNLDISTDKGRSDLAQALLDQTILSGPRYVLAEIYARRVPTVDSTDSEGKKSKKSMIQVMEDEANNRYLNAKYIATLKSGYETALKSSDPTVKALANLYEIAIMDAYRNWMEYQKFRQMERIEGLLSVLIVQNFRSTKAGQAAFSQVSGQATKAQESATEAAKSAAESGAAASGGGGG